LQSCKKKSTNLRCDQEQPRSSNQKSTYAITRKPSVDKSKCLAVARSKARLRSDDALPYCDKH
jgi:hypothetical protein